MAFVQRTIKKDALRDLIESGSVPFKQNSRSYILSCPKCGKAKLYVEKTSGRCRCMHCQGDMSGYADYVLSQVYSCTKAELAHSLFGCVQDGVFEEATSNLEDWWHEWENVDEIILESTSTPPMIVWDPDIVDLTHRLGAKGLNYLTGRGITLELAQKYGIRYHPGQKRVIFPCFVNGLLRGWQARYILRNEYIAEDGREVFIPKIVTTGAIGGRALMGQDGLKGKTSAILVEGPVDRIKCDLCPAVTVASMGKNYTETQAQILLKSGIKRLYVGLDPDATEMIERASKDFSKLELYRLTPPADKKDLGDCSLKEVLDRFEKAEKLESWQSHSHFEELQF